MTCDDIMYDEHVTMTAPCPTIRRRFKNAVAHVAAVRGRGHARRGRLAGWPRPHRSLPSVAPSAPAASSTRLTPARILDSRDAVARHRCRRAPSRLAPRRRSSSTSRSSAWAACPAATTATPTASTTTCSPSSRTSRWSQPTQVGYLTMLPEGLVAGRPRRSLNFKPDRPWPTRPILRPGRTARSRSTSSRPAEPAPPHLSIDITGWFSTSAYSERGDRVVTVDPIRVYDQRLTRFDAFDGAAKEPIVDPTVRPSSTTRTTPVVPDDPNIVGVIVNITGVNAFGGASRPTCRWCPRTSTWPTPRRCRRRAASTSRSGQTRANLAIVPVGSDGQIRLFNARAKCARSSTSPATCIEESRRVDPCRSCDPARVAVPGVRHSRGRRSSTNPSARPRPRTSASKPSSTTSGSTAEARRRPSRAVRQPHRRRGCSGSTPWAPVELVPDRLPVADRRRDGATERSPTSTSPRARPCRTWHCSDTARYRGAESIRFFNRAGYVDYLLDVYAVVLAD